MDFRTKGTVRIELREPAAGSSSTSSLICKVLISPAQSHAVTVEKQEYIAFVKTPAPATGISPVSVPASLWPKNTKFEVADALQPVLLEAAAQSLSLEIDIDDTSPNKIVGVVFPSSDK